MKKFLGFGIAALLVLGGPLSAAAQDVTTPSRPDVTTPVKGPDVTTPKSPAGTSQTPPAKLAKLPNPLGDKVSDIPSLLYKVINFVVGLSYAVVAFFLILSGFKFVAARGNPTKLDDAKHTFYYTIIGALIVIGANTIVKIFEGLIRSLGL